MAKTLAKFYAENTKPNGKNLTIPNFCASGRWGRHEQLQSYIDDGGDVNVEDAGGFTCLIWSCINNQPKSVEILLKANANVNHANKQGITALQWAARNNCFRCVELLLEAGADIDQPNEFLQTPLMEASTFGRVEIVKLLLEKGAETCLRDVNRETALDHAQKPEIKALLVAQNQK